MGFEVNNFHKPIIKEAQTTQDGGAGNLGYFEREEEKKKKEQEKSIFSEGSDSFQKHDELMEETDDFSISKLIAQIILIIKEWFKKMQKSKEA